MVVDKPLGLSSNQVSSRIRRLAGQKKVGYAGTLDPAASGILVMAIGQATRLLQYLSACDKQYLARIRFGVSTDTEDAQGQVIEARGCRGELSGETLEQALGKWRGEVLQVPSKFSALKISGQRAYDLARNGKAIELQPRPVRITRLELRGEPRPGTIPTPPIPQPDLENRNIAGEITVTDADVVVDCSAGTYIRALSRDLGEELRCGAHLAALRRSRVGDYTLEDAASLEELARQVTTQGMLQVIDLDRAVLALFPAVQVTPAQARALAFGQKVQLEAAQLAELGRRESAADCPASGARQGIWAAKHPDGRVIALVKLPQGRVVTQWVLRPATGGEHERN